MFFLKDESGAVHVEGGEGLFFMSPQDAKAKLQGLKGADGVKVKHAQCHRGGVRLLHFVLSVIIALVEYVASTAS